MAYSAGVARTPLGIGRCVLRPGTATGRQGAGPTGKKPFVSVTWAERPASGDYDVSLSWSDGPFGGKQSMKNVPEAVVDSFVRACRQAADYGLMRCSSGNLSLRVEGERLLVKASRSWMARMSPDDVSLCHIADGSLIEGRKPSVEIRFHAGILKARSDVNVVMHFQTPCATALACRRSEHLNYFVIPEIPFYVGPVARVPYLAPGSPELAQAVTDAMRTHDMVVMSNHGQVTVARDVNHAIQNAVFFELASEIILRSGDAAAPLPEREVEALLALRQSNRANV